MAAARRYDGFGTMPLAGRWRGGGSGMVAADTDPWTGEILAEIPMADAADLDEALAAVEGAQREWAAAATRPPRGGHAGRRRGPAGTRG